MSTAQGSVKAPAWAPESEAEKHCYGRVEDVVLCLDEGGSHDVTTAVDLQGRELWTRDRSHPVVLGPRLLLATDPDGTQDYGFSELREVDPRTGSPVNEAVYEDDFESVMEIPIGGVAILNHDMVTILDNNLEPLQRIPHDDLRFYSQGQELLYISVNTVLEGKAKKPRLSAIDPSDSSVVWTLDLDWGQQVMQLGQAPDRHGQRRRHRPRPAQFVMVVHRDPTPTATSVGTLC